MHTKQAEMPTGRKFRWTLWYFKSLPIITDFENDFLRLEVDRKPGVGCACFNVGYATRILTDGDDVRMVAGIPILIYGTALVQDLAG